MRFALFAAWGFILCTTTSCNKTGADMDCRGENACTIWGDCTPTKQDHGWVCSAGKPEDCAASRGCAEWGACGLPVSSCMPTDPKHCESAKICTDHGACTYKTGSACGECFDATPPDAYHGYESFGLRLVGASANHPDVDVGCCCPSDAATEPGS